jgi:carbon-monoxide dehydrogenase small subunit
MTLPFILNGEDVTVNVEPNRRLIDILRSEFAMTGSKAGCLGGRCGACAVIFNGSISPACLIPAFRIRGAEIITIEGFSLTEDYDDVTRAFSMHDVESCDFCGAAKILLTETLLGEKELPARDEILSAFDGVKCRCAAGENLVDAVIEASKIRRRRHVVRNG